MGVPISLIKKLNYFDKKVKSFFSTLDTTAPDGFEIDGAIVKDGQGYFSALNELVAGAGIAFKNAVIRFFTATAKNVTATLTAAEFMTGLITSTSAAAVALTLPTAAAIVTLTGAARGTTFDFIVDNSVGANTVTVTVNTGITAATAVLTGGATLTVAATAVGHFRLYFISNTAALLYRIA